MRLVYIAGPYRAKTVYEVSENIHRARQLGAKVAELGLQLFPVIPHTNTAFFDGLREDAYWLEGTMEVMRRCDAVLLVDGWHESSGTIAETAEADRRGIPVFRNLSDLTDWAKG
jgi:nucleoside 2-deoxyribosyltransferase